MNDGFRFVPDEAGIIAVATSDDVADLLTEVAQEAAAAVRRLGPTGDDFFDYSAGVNAVSARGGRDIEAGVVVDSPGWHLVEYGTARISPRAPLRKGVTATVPVFEEGERSLASHYNDAIRGMT